MRVYGFGVEVTDPEAEETLFTTFALATEYGVKMYESGLEDDDKEDGLGQEGFEWCGTCDEHLDRFFLIDKGMGHNPDGSQIHTFYYVRPVPVFATVEEALPGPRPVHE
jgi:hypothetical protein